MFATNEAIGGMVDALVLKCSKLNRGDVLTREAIGEVVGVPPNEAHWQHVVNRVRARVLDERKIAMWPVTTVGFRLLTVTEQAQELPGLRMKKARRQCRRAEVAVKALDGLAGLTMHQRRLRAASLESLGRLKKQISAEARSVALASRPTPVNPRPARSKVDAMIAAANA